MTVELLPSGQPDDAPEEQLAVGEPSRRRGWWVLVVLVAGVTVWSLTRAAHSPSPRHQARPVPPVSTLADPACVGLDGCSVHAGVPRAIARLVRAYLPPRARLQVRTVVASGPSAEVSRF